MKNFLNLIEKKGKTVFILFLFVITLFIGCGKDDKSTTSVIPISPYGVSGNIDRSYLDSQPKNFSVSEDPAGIKLQWEPPASGKLPDAYYIYFTVGLEGGFTDMKIKKGDESNYTDTTATTSGKTYFYYMTSVFNIYDSTYNFWVSSVESKPTEIHTIRKK